MKAKEKEEKDMVAQQVNYKMNILVLCFLFSVVGLVVIASKFSNMGVLFAEYVCTIAAACFTGTTHARYGRILWGSTSHGRYGDATNASFWHASDGRQLLILLEKYRRNTSCVRQEAHPFFYLVHRIRSQNKL